MSELEKLSDLEHRIAINIPQTEVAALFQQRLAEIARTTNMKGFRPGKVPFHLVEARLGKQLAAEVAEKLIHQSLEKAVDEHKVNIAGMPKIDCKALEKDQDFSYTATFEVYPEIALTDLVDVEIERMQVQLTDGDVAVTAERLAKQHTKWNEVDVAVAAENGNRVTLDFDGFIDDQPFDGGSSKDFVLELGSKQMIPGFEDGLVGVKAGDNKDLPVAFPDDYAVEDLAGKSAIFKVTVHKVEAGESPAIDDALATELGFDDVAALNVEIKKNLSREYTSTQRNQFKQQVLDQLLERNQIEVPNALVDGEIEHMQKMFMQQLAAQQGKEELPKMDLPREPYEKEAKKRVVLGLLLAEVIKKFELKLDQSKVQDRLDEIAASYEKKEEVIQWYRSNKQMMAEVEAAVLEDQAIEKLVENASIKDVEVSFEEFTEKLKNKEESND